MSFFSPNTYTTTQTPTTYQGFGGLYDALAGGAGAAYQQPFPYVPADQAIAPLNGNEQQAYSGFGALAGNPTYDAMYSDASRTLRNNVDPSSNYWTASDLLTKNNAAPGSGFNTAMQGLGAPVNYSMVGAPQVGAYEIQQLMSPYMKDVVDSAASNFDYDADRQRATQRAQNAGRQAFGSGGDQAVAALDKSLGTQRSSLITGLMNSGYQNAVEAANANANRGLTAGTANQGAGLTAQQLQRAGLSQLGGLANQYQQAVNSGAGTLGTLGIGQQQQGNSAATSLGGLAAPRAQTAQQILQGLLSSGAYQRAYDQQAPTYNVAQTKAANQYPWQQNQSLANILASLPRGSTSNAPTASDAQQATGLGLGLAGILGGNSGAGSAIKDAGSGIWDWLTGSGGSDGGLGSQAGDLIENLPWPAKTGGRVPSGFGARGYATGGIVKSGFMPPSPGKPSPKAALGGFSGRKGKPRSGFADGGQVDELDDDQEGEDTLDLANAEAEGDEGGDGDQEGGGDAPASLAAPLGAPGPSAPPVAIPPGWGATARPAAGSAAREPAFLSTPWGALTMLGANLAGSQSPFFGQALGQAVSKTAQEVGRERQLEGQAQDRAERNAIRQQSVDARQQQIAGQAQTAAQKVAEAARQTELFEDAIKGLPPDQQRLARLDKKAFVQGVNRAPKTVMDGEGLKERQPDGSWKIIGPPIDRSTRINNTVHLPPQENATQVELGKTAGKAFDEARDKAVSGNTTLGLTGQIRESLDKGLQTGTGADIRMGIANAATTFGMDPKMVDTFFNAPAGKEFTEASNQMVLAFIKGLGANPSNTDREFIERTVPQMRDNPAVVRAILDRIEERSHKAIEKYQGILAESPVIKGSPLLAEAKTFAKRAAAAAPSAVPDAAPKPAPAVPAVSPKVSAAAPGEGVTVPLAPTLPKAEGSIITQNGHNYVMRAGKWEPAP